jgi:carbonic anhydrase
MRNVANMVVNTDVSMLGALQFAVTVLGVKQIIVCGHYDCGGVRASMKKADVGPPLEMWVRNLRDVYRTHQKELDAIVDPEQRHRRMVEINVVEQCVNLYKTGIIQKQRIETSKDPNCNFSAPVIHACVFDPKNGLLKQLDISFDDYLAEFREVYEMYGSIVTDSTPHPPKAPDVPTMATEKLSEKKLSAKKLSAENLFVEKLLNEAEEKLSEEKLAADKLSAVKKYFIMEANPLSGDLVGGIKSL